jgi:murein DD-endopeptidase MepM/ murein hydrolase activator NlpD
MYSLGKILLLIILTLQTSAIAASYTTKSRDTWKILEKNFKIPAKMLQRYNKTQILKARIKIPVQEIYAVKDGETALGIAVKFGMTLSELAEINHLEAPYAVKLGQKLIIYYMKEEPKTSKIKKEQNAKLKFIWPIQGKVIKKFGMQENGINNDGIYITIHGISDVKAAEQGEIVYVGNEIGDFGNLVLIQHPNNWFSSYGHLTQINAKKGDVIKSGQIIGNIENSELYFSLRKNEKAIDPQKYLPQRKKR